MHKVVITQKIVKQNQKDIMKRTIKGYKNKHKTATEKEKDKKIEYRRNR